MHVTLFVSNLEVSRAPYKKRGEVVHALSVPVRGFRRFGWRHQHSTNVAKRLGSHIIKIANFDGVPGSDQAVVAVGYRRDN